MGVGFSMLIAVDILFFCTVDIVIDIVTEVLEGVGYNSSVWM
jgi:hypothetical protein